MKVNNTNEELFDGLFKENLGNASMPPPPGVWEGISSSIGASGSAAIAGAAVKTALWMKAAIVITTVAVVSTVIYQISSEPEVLPNLPTQTEVNPVIPESTKNNNTSIDATETVTDKVITPSISSESAQKEVLKTEQNNPTFTVPNYWNPKKEFYVWTPSGSGDVRLEAQTAEKQDSTSANAEENGIDKSKQNNDPLLEEASQTETIPLMDNGSIIVPNAFTPNGDGANDTFQIRINGEESVQITIYSNRDGSVLFTSNSKYIGWDGKLPNGELAPVGPYYVRVVYTMKGKPKETETIRINLLR